MSWLKYVVLAALLSLSVTGCVAGNLVAGSLVRPMRVPVVGSPRLAHEPLTVTTADGIALDGWLFRPDAAPRGLVVLVHGKDINRQHFVGAAERFVKEGFAVVAYDQRAHGASTGEFVTYGAREVGDLRTVLDASLEKVGRTLPVVVIGESLGAAVSLQTAAVDERIRVVIAGAPFADLETVVKDRAPFFLSDPAREHAVELAETAAGFKVADISPERAAKDIHVPTMLLHGSEDQFLPMKHSLRIYENLSVPKRFVRLEGVDHIGVLLTDGAWKEIDRFVNEQLPAGVQTAQRSN